MNTMPEHVAELYPDLTLEIGQAYPARYDMQKYNDPFPEEVDSNAAYALSEAFEIAKERWGENGGTFTPFESGAHRAIYPMAKKPEPAPL